MIISRDVFHSIKKFIQKQLDIQVIQKIDRKIILTNQLAHTIALCAWNQDVKTVISIPYHQIGQNVSKKLEKEAEMLPTFNLSQFYGIYKVSLKIILHYNKWTERDQIFWSLSKMSLKGV